MAAFTIAIRLWLGTLIIMTGILFVIGVFTLNGAVVFGGIVMFVIGLILSLPLWLSSVALVIASGRLPYSTTARLWWLGAMLLLQNLAYLYFFGAMKFFFLDLYSFQFIFYLTGIALIIMLLGSRNSIKRYYSEQITSNQQL